MLEMLDWFTDVDYYAYVITACILSIPIIIVVRAINDVFKKGR